MKRVAAGAGVLVAISAVIGCNLPVSDGYKRHMCTEAEEGAAFRCKHLGISEEVCSDIASEAFRLCYESMPEKYAR